MKTKIYQLLLLTTLSCQAFQYQAPINGVRTTGTEVEFIKVPIQQTVFSKLRYDFRDLVVLTKDAKSVPFTFAQNSIKTQKPYSTYQRVDVDHVKIEKDTISVNLKFKKPRKISSLKITTPLKDFEFLVTLKSKTGEIIAQQSIYDYSSFTTSRSELVSFPSRVLQQFTVTIEGLSKLQTKELFEWRETNIGQGEAKVEKTSKINTSKPRFSFSVGTTKYLEKFQKIYEPVKSGLISWRTEEKGAKTVIVIDTNKLPISVISLDIAEKNFTRHFSVRSLNNRQTLLKRGTIQKWNYRKYQKNTTQIMLPKFKSGSIVLTIENGTQSPVTIKDIRFELPQYCVFFLMEPTVAYFINFGDLTFSATSAKLPSTIMNNTREIMVGKMGEVQQKEVKINNISSKNYGFLITPIVLLCMGILAWVIFDTLKKTNRQD